MRSPCAFLEQNTIWGQELRGCAPLFRCALFSGTTRPRNAHVSLRPTRVKLDHASIPITNAALPPPRQRFGCRTHRCPIPFGGGASSRNASQGSCRSASIGSAWVFSHSTRGSLPPADGRIPWRKCTRRWTPSRRRAWTILALT